MNLVRAILWGSPRKVGETNKGLGEASKSCTRKEHESANNSIAKRGQGAIAPCRVKGQRPLWGLGQGPNCFAGDNSQGSRQQRCRQRSVPASNFARPQTRPQAALPPSFREEPIFVQSADSFQSDIRAGVDFRWVIIALIGGEEVVERLRTGRLVVNRLFIGIWHRDLSPFWKFTANEVIPCRQHALPLHHTEEGGRCLCLGKTPYSFPPPTATPAMMNLLRKR